MRASPPPPRGPRVRALLLGAPHPSPGGMAGASGHRAVPQFSPCARGRLLATWGAAPRGNRGCAEVLGLGAPLTEAARPPPHPGPLQGAPFGGHWEALRPRKPSLSQDLLEEEGEQGGPAGGAWRGVTAPSKYPAQFRGKGWLEERTAMLAGTENVLSPALGLWPSPVSTREVRAAMSES